MKKCQHLGTNSWAFFVLYLSIENVLAATSVCYFSSCPWVVTGCSAQEKHGGRGPLCFTVLHNRWCVSADIALQAHTPLLCEFFQVGKHTGSIGPISESWLYMRLNTQSESQKWRSVVPQISAVFYSLEKGWEALVGTMLVSSSEHIVNNSDFATLAFTGRFGC